MKKVPLSQGKFALVDDKDFVWVSQFKWSYDPKGYAFRNTQRPNRRIFYLHRAILEAKKGEYCDHINGDKLDNRRENLRLCTNAQNVQNRRLGKNNTSGFKGVFWDKVASNWYVQITANRKVFCVGRTETKEEAALLYNKKALEFHGEFALLNKV